MQWISELVHFLVTVIFVGSVVLVLNWVTFVRTVRHCRADKKTTAASADRLKEEVRRRRE